MGLFDRLRGRSRYAAGTTPDSAGESPPSAPEWSGSAPPEWPETTASRQTPEVPESEGLLAYVTAEDVAAAYGLTDVRTEQEPPADDVVTHTIAAGEGGRGLEIYVCDHRACPGMARDDEASWRAIGPVEELAGIADAAFVNSDGTVFARVGEDWTVQVTTGEWNPPVEQTAELVRRIVGRLTSAAEVAGGLRPAPPPETAAPAEIDEGPSPSFPPPVLPPSRRPHRGLVFGMFMVGCAAVAGVTFLARSVSDDNSDSGSGPPFDLLAEVAAEPDRRITAQDIDLRLTDHEPMRPGLCPDVAGCETASRAELDVVEHGFRARTWLLVFPDSDAALAGADVLRRQPGLVDPDAPAGSLTFVFDPGRYAQIVQLTTVDGTPVANDDRTRAVLRGIGAIGIESVSVDDVRRLGR